MDAHVSTAATRGMIAACPGWCDHVVHDGLGLLGGWVLAPEDP